MKTTITPNKGLPQTTHIHLVQDDYPNAWPSAPAGFTVWYLKLSVDQGPHKLAHLHDHFYTLAEGNEADVKAARKHLRKEIRKLGGSIKQAEYDEKFGYPTWTWHQPATWVDPELVDQGNAGLTDEESPRYLICTRGCKHDTQLSAYKLGGNCKNILTYDVIGGTSYCRRIIKADPDQRPYTHRADDLTDEELAGIEQATKDFEEESGLTLNPKPDLKPVLAPGTKLDDLLAEIEEKFWELYHSCEHDFDAVWNNILDSDRRFYQVSDSDVSKLEAAIHDRI